MTKIIKFKYSDLPDPVRKDFMLEVKNDKIGKKEICPILKENFIDSEKSSFAFYTRLPEKGEK